MAKLKEKDEKFIRDNFDNADEILALEDLNDILDEIFLWIEIHGLDEDEFPNEKGMKAQEVYDSIYAYP